MIGQAILTAKQETLLNTCELLLARCAEHSEAIKIVPRYFVLYEAMKMLVQKVRDASTAKQVSQDTKGITAEKNFYFADAITEVDALAKIVLLIAANENQSDWEQKASKVLKTKTKGLSAENFTLVAKSFLNCAQSIESTLLAQYAIEPIEIADLQTRVDALKDYRTKGQTAQGQKKLDHKVVVNTFEEMKKTLTEMSVLNERFKAKKSAFYEVHQIATAVPPKVGPKSARSKKAKARRTSANAASKPALPPANPPTT